MYYRKRPVIVEALVYEFDLFLDSLGNSPAFLKAAQEGIFEETVIDGIGCLIIRTLEDGPNGEAKHIADQGDFIIRGVQGEFYACKPEIFHATYEFITNYVN